jgi:hypothetical protein
MFKKRLLTLATILFFGVSNSLIYAQEPIPAGAVEGEAAVGVGAGEAAPGAAVGAELTASVVIPAALVAAGVIAAIIAGATGDREGRVTPTHATPGHH